MSTSGVTLFNIFYLLALIISTCASAEELLRERTMTHRLNAPIASYALYAHSRDRFSGLGFRISREGIILEQAFDTCDTFDGFSEGAVTVQ